uniref:Olfactomedin-like domain-containing protein n=1 Tax=Rhabditophanes sp. KR3021 TaxID=114890 RepID=A0AC35TKG5_9BILA
MNCGRVRMFCLLLFQLVNIALVVTVYLDLFGKIGVARQKVGKVGSSRRFRRDSEGGQEFDDWTVLIGQDTIIPRAVFEKSCSRVHRYCADSGKKLRGFVGPPGEKGRSGGAGSPGKRGKQGPLGPPGLVGDIGAEGAPGEEGKCNCTLPSLYVHRIPIPGPPIIQIHEKQIPVPVVVVKEVEVTRLVPYEPTPPGFAPPNWWKVGMPIPDKSEYQIIKATTGTTPKLKKVTKPYIKKGPVGPPKKKPEPEKALPNISTITSTTPDPIPSTTTYGGLPTLGYNRRECMLNAVGIPVLHAESQYRDVGSWMRDANPQTDDAAQKRWVTDDYASPVLYEYADEKQLSNKKQQIKYYVDYLASGTGSMIYNGSYFYHRHGSAFLVRYDLETTGEIQAEMADIAYLDCERNHDHTFQDCNETDRDPWLYNRPHNYVDYAVDENGIWMIYVKPESNHLFINKIETDFYVVQTWEISDVNGTEIADAFIMCGILYVLDSGTERDSRITYAYNLYTNVPIDIDVPWYNPYRKLSMLHYNPVDGRLYFFDSRRLLSVNVRISTDFTEKEKENGENNGASTASPYDFS